MVACACTDVHEPRRVVLTGGPGAGKTALLELIRQSFCSHVKVLPEAAGVVFGGGFPREDDPTCRRAAQRAIFYVQRELENAGDSHNPAVVLCDRGTVDGLAYWPGPSEEYWSSLGTTLETELGRYDAVLHLRTPPAERGYNNQNPREPRMQRLRPISTRAFCKPGSDTRDGSSWSHPPNSSTRPHGRSQSFAASCQAAASTTSSRQSTTVM